MTKLRITVIFALTLIIVVTLYAEQKHKQAVTAADAAISRHGELLVQQGRQIFRYDTFGDQDYWGLLGLHQAIEGASLGGVGSGVSPATALAVGLKVDQDALPPALVQQISAGRMHGKGTFSDARLDDAVKFPIAARNHFGHVQNETDLISSKLAALQAYQLAIDAPAPPKGSFDAGAAAKGVALFNGKAQCSTCHTNPTETEPGWNMHTAAEICIDDFQASRSPDDRYRTTP
jgi:hypothetical protein